MTTATATRRQCAVTTDPRRHAAHVEILYRGRHLGFWCHYHTPASPDHPAVTIRPLAPPELVHYPIPHRRPA